MLFCLARNELCSGENSTCSPLRLRWRGAAVLRSSKPIERPCGRGSGYEPEQGDGGDAMPFQRNGQRVVAADTHVGVQAVVPHALTAAALNNDSNGELADAKFDAARPRSRGPHWRISLSRASTQRICAVPTASVRTFAAGTDRRHYKLARRSARETGRGFRTRRIQKRPAP